MDISIKGKTYEELDQILQGRNKQSRKIGNNTLLHRAGDNIALQYHDTDVVTRTAHGRLILDSGGWHTTTTKERINWMLPPGYYLTQSAGKWHLEHNGQESYAFADGMYIDQAGKVQGAGKETPKADKKMKDRVKAYAAKCAAAIPLDQPGPGDCWYCVMKTEDGKSLGDAFKDTSHIDSHIKQGYIVPSLVYNALTECYNAPMAFYQTFKDTGWNSEDRDFGRQATAKAVYRYILKRKGFAV